MKVSAVLLFLLILFALFFLALLIAMSITIFIDAITDIEEWMSRHSKNNGEKEEENS